MKNTGAITVNMRSTCRTFDRIGKVRLTFGTLAIVVWLCNSLTLLGQEATEFSKQLPDVKYIANEYSIGRSPQVPESTTSLELDFIQRSEISHLLHGLPRLKSLAISHSDIDNSAYREMLNSDSLLALKIERVTMPNSRGPLPQHSHIRELELLDFEGDLPDLVPGSVQDLHLRYSKRSGGPDRNAMEFIANLDSLHSLSIECRSSQLTPVDLFPLIKKSRVQKLSISNALISSSAVKKLKHLEDLQLAFCVVPPEANSVPMKIQRLSYVGMERPINGISANSIEWISPRSTTTNGLGLDSKRLTLSLGTLASSGRIHTAVGCGRSANCDINLTAEYVGLLDKEGQISHFRFLNTNFPKTRTALNTDHFNEVIGADRLQSVCLVYPRLGEIKLSVPKLEGSKLRGLYIKADLSDSEDSSLLIAESLLRARTIHFLALDGFTVLPAMGTSSESMQSIESLLLQNCNVDSRWLADAVGEETKYICLVNCVIDNSAFKSVIEGCPNLEGLSVLDVRGTLIRPFRDLEGQLPFQISLAVEDVSQIDRERFPSVTSWTIKASKIRSSADMMRTAIGLVERSKVSDTDLAD